MKRFVLDCSVAAAWCFADEKNSYVPLATQDKPLRATGRKCGMSVFAP